VDEMEGARWGCSWGWPPAAAGSVHGIVFEYRCLQIRQDGQKITPGFWLVGDKVDHLGAPITPYERSLMQTILLVDPETDFLEWAENQLETATTRVLTATTADEGYKIYISENPDLLVSETHLMPFSGLELLARIRQRDTNAMVILMSAFGTTQSVIESMKLGAFDYLRKESLPFNLKPVVDAALTAQAEMRSATAFKPQLTVEQYQDSLVGQSQAMQQVFKMVGRVSHSDAPVMITGESGSGKELVARAIHHYSNRSSQTFIAINCAAIPENLLESELFGHERGAFTGAASQRIGRFEQSNGGTLFLDEIGEMALPVQSKILRVLQEGEFSRVGGNAVIKTDVRIIAATNKTLEQEVAKKQFREDLFYRLNVVRIHLPPLRQRKEDIRLLAEYFLKKIATQKHLPQVTLSAESIKVLEDYPWPGNVRELENTIQRACVLATSDVLLPKDIPLGSAGQTDLLNGDHLPTSVGGGTRPSLDMAVETLLDAAASDPTIQLLPWLEREFTVSAMKRTKGNQVKAAKLLGVTRATLRKRIERYGITKELSFQ
jgi:DNA-binding NtrC family response regulator